MRSRRSLLLWAGLCLGLLLAFVLDAPVLARVQPLHESHLAQMVRDSIRRLGTGQVQAALLVLMVLAGSFLSGRVRSAGAWALVAFAVSGVAVNVLKVVFPRPRPWVTDPPPHSLASYLHTAGFQSFPSGDSATTFAVAALLGYRSPALGIPLLTTAAVVAAARVFVGAHHPSDVWAAAMLGLGVAQLVESYARRRAAQETAGDDCGAHQSWQGVFASLISAVPGH
jgi:undecaprenyl-diphosphatase